RDRSVPGSGNTVEVEEVALGGTVPTAARRLVFVRWRVAGKGRRPGAVAVPSGAGGLDDVAALAVGRSGAAAPAGRLLGVVAGLAVALEAVRLGLPALTPRDDVVDVPDG